MNSELLLLVVTTPILVFLWMLMTRKANILDKPWPDVPQRERVPTAQGLFLLVIVFVYTLLRRPEDLSLGIGEHFTWLRLGIFLIAGVTLIDELGRIYHPSLRISAHVRLFVQSVAGILAFLVSDIWISEILLPGGILLTFGTVTTLILTVAWFWLFVNAINRFDGIYGLASWMSSIGFLTLRLLIGVVVLTVYDGMSVERVALLQWVQRYAVVFLVLAVCATVMEFRPSGLVRDVGTMTFGFVLAYLSLLWWAKIGTMMVVLMLPLFDAIRVIIDRVFRRKVHPFKGDFTHLHYRLLALWRSRTEARCTIRGISLVFMVLMLLQWADKIGKILIFVMMACLFFGLNRYLFRKKGLPSEYRRKKQ